MFAGLEKPPTAQASGGETLQLAGKFMPPLSLKQRIESLLAKAMIVFDIYGKLTGQHKTSAQCQAATLTEVRGLSEAVTSAATTRLLNLAPEEASRVRDDPLHPANTKSAVPVTEDEARTILTPLSLSKFAELGRKFPGDKKDELGREFPDYSKDIVSFVEQAIAERVAGYQSRLLKDASLPRKVSSTELCNELARDLVVPIRNEYGDETLCLLSVDVVKSIMTNQLSTLVRSRRNVVMGWDDVMRVLAQSAEFNNLMIERGIAAPPEIIIPSQKPGT